VVEHGEKMVIRANGYVWDSWPAFCHKMPVAS
jgi:hypothetical protein